MNVGKAIRRALGIGGASALGGFALLVAVSLTPGPAGRWAHNVLLSIDQGANALLGGDPDETISSRLGKWLAGDNMARRAFARVVCPALDLLMLERDHCRKSVDQTTGGKAVLP